MTSPVDTTVKYFMSDMPGAPVMNGTAGAMIAVLDACLINGFGLKTVDSLVVSGNVATMSISTGHSHTVDSVALIAGATPADLNGEQRITAVTTTTVSFATTGIANQTATGTITTKMAPAGWLKPFSGTNLAVYKSALPESTGMYLRVDDTATTMTKVVGYESMADISSGAGAFPSASQVPGGGQWAKSTYANSTAVNWAVISDGRSFIVHIAISSGYNASYIQGHTRGFGDFIPFKPAGDVYACSLNYAVSTTPAAASTGTLDAYRGSYNTNALPRGVSGLGGSALYYLCSYIGTNANEESGSDTGSGSLGRFPSSVDGGLRLSKSYFGTASGNADPRGELAGLYYVPHSFMADSFRAGDKLVGTGPIAGRTLLALNPSAGNPTTFSNTSAGVSFVDITGPWR
ncbi:MAG: hypothetical protein GZ090_01380 [Oxalobacteraceae bacterium]|nr:hypothetical protein [Oxalobacteraceae bacterium]